MPPTLSDRVRSLTRRHLSFFSWALLVDWLVVVGLWWIGTYIERQEPYERDVMHYLGDHDISWPHTQHERVSVRNLNLLSVYLPLALIVLVSALRRSVQEMHHAALGLLASRALMTITVEFIKNRVGRLRPDFLDRCAYSVISHDCTGPHYLVKDGRRSFPSGLFFMCLFFAGKNGAFAFQARFPRSTILQSRMLRLALTLSPLILATWIAITRLEDHMHHPTDVLAGSTIGILTASLGYTLYWNNPFDADKLHVMACARKVYGAEEGEGELFLEREGVESELEEGARRGAVEEC
ncbi:BZ3500_MvSof-1268-A1-R1_Chr11-1g03143 [Microbotryum saponariae]|uniref:BZ3500_MvSof-1268-A1-R1_Chr11-1g03143 protein n=1 Tax=Microbotryum saponariae TaxID=289078 RepID=A0A2X0N6B7_9BASI|nr:BZ3501_MvSof-1269-A2-R1_Chr11g02718 [Microbotryum saponariae]SDA03703.1 BZ3500_MvSof-1268-A1-R1_Chr11-1g03143 [Microbotryum saponariae]